MTDDKKQAAQSYEDKIKNLYGLTFDEPKPEPDQQQSSMLLDDETYQKELERLMKQSPVEMTGEEPSGFDNFSRAFQSTEKNLRSGMYEFAGQVAREHTGDRQREQFVKQVEQEKKQPAFIPQLKDIEAIDSQIAKLQQEYNRNFSQKQQVTPYGATVMDLGDKKATAKKYKIIDDIASLNYRKKMIEQYGDINTAVTESVKQLADQNTFAAKAFKKAAELRESAPYFNPDSPSGFIGSAIPSVLPSLAAVVSAPFTSGSSLSVLPWALGIGNMTALTASSAGSALADYKAYMEDKGIEPDDATMWKVGIAHGSFEAVAETLRLPRFLPKGLFAKSLVNEILEKGGINTIDKMLAEYTQRTGGNILRKYGKEILKQGAEEGAEEIFTEIGQELSNTLYLAPEDRKGLKDIAVNAARAGAAGFMSGMFIGGARAATMPYMQRRARKQNGSVTLAEVTDDEMAKDMPVVEIVQRAGNGYLAYSPQGEQFIIPESSVGQIEEIDLESFNNYQTAVQKNKVEAGRIEQEIEESNKERKIQRNANYIAERAFNPQMGGYLEVRLNENPESDSYPDAAEYGYVVGSFDGNEQIIFNPQTNKLELRDKKEFFGDPNFIEIDQKGFADQIVQAFKQSQIPAAGQDQKNIESKETKAFADKLSVGLSVTDPQTNDIIDIVDITTLDEGFVLVSRMDADGNETTSQLTIDAALDLFGGAIAEKETVKAPVNPATDPTNGTVETKTQEAPAVMTEKQIADAEKPQIPVNKQGEVEFDKITDPEMYAQGLRQEFAEEAPAVLTELISEAQQAVEKAKASKNAIERVRKTKAAQSELDKLQQVQQLMNPAQEEEQPTTSTPENVVSEVQNEDENVTPEQKQQQQSDIERRRQEELNIEQLPIERVKRKNGAIGTQGVTTEQVAGILESVLGLNIPENATMKNLVDLFLLDKANIDKLLEFTNSNPINITELPDGTIQINDGHHRAFLLDQAGITELPITRNNSDEINAKYDAELAALQQPAAQATPEKSQEPSRTQLEAEADEATKTFTDSDKGTQEEPNTITNEQDLQKPTAEEPVQQPVQEVEQQPQAEAGTQGVGQENQPVAGGVEQSDSELIGREITANAPLNKGAVKGKIVSAVPNPIKEGLLTITLDNGERVAYNPNKPDEYVWVKGLKKEDSAPTTEAEPTNTTQNAQHNEPDSGAVPTSEQPATTDTDPAQDTAETVTFEASDGNTYTGKVINTFPSGSKEIETEDGEVWRVEPEKIQSAINKVDQAASQVNTNPTDPQKEAGNYKKGHVNVQGFDITIENPKGSTRSGTDKDGKPWSVEMKNHYGYFKRTNGKDGDQIDTFIGENIESPKVFVVDQNNDDGAFDESKVMLGFDTAEQAQAAYMSNYSPGWKGFGSITETTVDDFKKWLYDGAKQRKAFAEYVDTPAPVSTSSTSENPNNSKQPWEMTREEFDTSDMYSEEVVGNFTEAQAQELNNDLSNPWIYTKYGGKPKRFKSHRKLIQQALSEGKTVPAEVLKNYPELQKESGGVSPAPIDAGLPEQTGTELTESVKTESVKAEPATPESLNERLFGESSKPTIREIADASGGRIIIGKLASTPQADKPKEYGADNKIVSKDRYEELKKRMKDKLNNLNVGFDPEILAIGTEMAAYHIEAGARTFNDFARKMVDELGDAIKPYLKSIYNGARDMPGMEELSLEMTEYSEVSKTNVNEIKNQNEESGRSTETIESETEAIEREAENVRDAATAAAIDTKIDAVLTDLNLRLNQLGYSTAGINHESPNIEVAKRIKKDVTKFSKELAKTLGWQHDTDRKGKTQIADANIAPAGGDATFILWSPDKETGVYVSIPYQPDYNGGYDNYGGSDATVLWRLTTKKDKFRGLGNRYAPKDVTIGQLSEMIKQAYESHTRQKAQPKAPITPESLNDKLFGEPVKNLTGNKKDSNLANENSEGNETTNGTDGSGTLQRDETGLPETTENTGTDTGVQGNRNAESGIGDAINESPEETKRTEPNRDNGNRQQPAGSGGGIAGGNTGRTDGGRNRTDNGQDSVKNSRNLTINRGDNLIPRGDNAKIKANIDAIKLAKKLNGEPATPAQMEVLKRYTGWGGLSSVFKRDHQYYEDLKKVLSQSEYDSARESTTTSFYTPIDLIDTVWTAVKKLGFKGGNVLDPSAGIGHFFGVMPEDLKQKSNLSAIELDEISGLILKSMYPDSKNRIAGFEDVQIPNNSLDLVITNVPFGTFKLHDSNEKDISKFNIHDFFIAKSVRKLKPGGLGVFVTTTSTLDRGDELRRWLANEGNADVIDAFRLNTDTFKSNAGTEASSDIIIIRKRDNTGKSVHAKNVLDTVIARQATYTVTEKPKNYWQSPVEIQKTATMTYNKFFVENPNKIAGEMKFGFEGGNEIRPTEQRVAPVKSKDQGAMLEQFINQLPELTLSEQTNTNNQADVDVSDSIKEGGLMVADDGTVYIIEDGTAVLPDWNTNKVNGYTKAQVVNDYIKIKDAVNKLIEAESENTGDVEKLRKDLNKFYDSFVDKVGTLNNNVRVNFLSDDVDFPAISALENVEEKTEIEPGAKKVDRYVITKSDIFTKRVVGGAMQEKAESIDDAINLSRYKKGKLNTEYASNLLNMDEQSFIDQALKEGKIFKNPDTGVYESKEDYLSGNVIEKMKKAEQANQDNEYNNNIDELKKVIPVPVPIQLIKLTLGSTWIPDEIYNKFFKEAFGYDPNIKKLSSGRFTANLKDGGGNLDISKGMEEAPGSKIALDAMNNKTTVITKREYNYDSRKYETRKDDVATMQAAMKQSELSDEFESWIKKQDKETIDQLEKTYNETFNAVIEKKIDVSAFTTFPNATSVKIPRQHQKEGVMRGLNKAVMLAHEVGTGKTITLISTAMEMRRLGLAKKPVIVVQRSTYKQFVNEIKSLYPGAKVLVPSSKDLTAAKRKQLFAKIAYNDWDIVVLYHSYLDSIPDDPTRIASYIQEKIEEKLELIGELRESGDPNSKRIESQIIQEIKKLEESRNDAIRESIKIKEASNIKQKEKSKKTAETRAKSLVDRKTDDVFTFEQLGVDALLIDEAHAYKKLGFVTNLQNIKGVDTGASKRAQSLRLKTSYILDNNNGRNVVLATGTPISNTMAEMWTFLRYLLPKEELSRVQMNNFDAFVNNFGEIEDSAEFSTSGKFKILKRFSKYSNIPELQSIWKQVAHTVLTEEITSLKAGVGTPNLAGGKPTDTYLPQTTALKAVMKSIKQRIEEFEKMTGKEKKENSHIPLVMFGLAKQAAIDVRIVVPDAPDDPGSKLNETVRIIMQKLQESNDYKGTIAVFSDSYQSRDKSFNVFEDIKKKLVAFGIKPEQVAIINDYKTDDKKEKLFKLVNSGEVRVILGTTEKLGVGVNIQERLNTLIHMDAPIRPSDYQQRNGRILRQGNLHLQMGIPVNVIRLGVEKTLDVTGYQRLKIKDDFIKQIMKSDNTDRSIEEIEVDSVDSSNFSNMMASLSGSSSALALELEKNKYRKLSNAKTYHETNQMNLASKINDAKRQIEYLEAFINGDENIILKNKALFNGNILQSITSGKETYNTEDRYNEFMKLVEKTIDSKKSELRADVTSMEASFDYPMKINGVNANMKIELKKEVDLESKKVKIYTTIKINAIDKTFVNPEHIYKVVDDYVTGKSLLNDIAYRKRGIADLENDIVRYQSEIGKPFDKESQLAESKEKIASLEAKMKEELAAIEAQEKAENIEAIDIGKIEQDDNIEEDESKARFMDTPTFYSPTERALDYIRQEKGTAAQFKAMLLKNGAKQAEMDWMGWDDRFPDGKKMVTKADIQQWIDENKIEVEEVVKQSSEPGTHGWDFTDEAQYKYDELKDKAQKWERLEMEDSVDELSKNGEKLLEEYRNEYGSLDDLYEEIQQFEYDNDNYKEDLTGDTKHSQYQEPGGSNYKEFVLTMPDQIEPYKPDNTHFTEEGGGTAVVWVRANEREVNGERVLFLEEIQSKRGQDGREKGFKGDTNYDAVLERENVWDVGGIKVLYFERGVDGKNYRTINKNGEQVWFKTLDDAIKQANETVSNTSEKEIFKVPSMPFRKTDQWVNLALRRMIKYAAENGFDRIAWTTGEQQADRYDLSKQVDSIVYTLDEGIVRIYPKFDPTPIAKRFNNQSELADIVGKDIADKIYSKEGTETGNGDNRELKGLDLKVGGEGMKAFYDAIVPAAAGKLGKPFGAKVEGVDINVGDGNEPWYAIYNKYSGNSIGGGYTLKEAQEYIKGKEDVYEYRKVKGKGLDESRVQSLPITQAMRESVIKGVPLFLRSTFDGRRSRRSSDESNENKRAVIEKLEKLRKSKNRSVIVDTVDELPKHVQNIIKNRNIQGMLYEGTTYYIIDNLADTQAAIDVWLHEQGVHYGITSLIPDSALRQSFFEQIFEDIGLDAIQKVVSKNDIKNFIEGKIDKALLGEEYMAYLVNKKLRNLPMTKEQDSIWKRFVRAINEFFEKLFTGRVRITEDTVLRIAKAAIQQNFMDNESLLGVSHEYTRQMLRHGIGYSTGQIRRNTRTATVESLFDEKPKFKIIGEKGAANLDKAEEATIRLDNLRVAKEMEKGKVEPKRVDILETFERRGTTINKLENTFWYPNQQIGDAFNEDHIYVSNGFVSALEKGLEPIKAISILDKNKYGEWHHLFAKNEDGTFETQQVRFSEPNPTQIKSATGNTGTFDGNNPDIRFMDSDMPPFDPQQTTAQIFSKNGRINIHAAIEIVQDFHHRWDVFNKLIKERDGSVPEWADVYLHSTLQPGKNEAEINKYDREIWKPLEKVIADITKTTGITVANLEKYMKAKHAPERNAKLRLQNPKADPEKVYAGSLDGKPLTDEYAQQQIELYEAVIGQENAARLWEALNKATRFSVQKYRDAGFIDADTFDELTGENGYQFYVPLRGWKQDKAADIFEYQKSQPGSGFQNPFIAAKGRESEADDPLAYIRSMAYTAILSGNKNVFKQKALNLAQVNKDMNDLLTYNTIYSVDMGKTDDETGETVWDDALVLSGKVYVIEGFTDEGEPVKSLVGDYDTLKNEGKIKTESDHSHYKRNTKSNAKQHEVIVYRGGKRYIVVMKSDPVLGMILNNKNPLNPQFSSENMQRIFNVPASLTRTMSKLLTSLNPAFIPVNFIRDIGYATISQGIRHEGEIKLFYKNLNKSRKAIHRHIKGIADPKNNTDDAMFERFLLNGGRTGYAFMEDLEKHRTKIERELKRLAGTNNKLDKFTQSKAVQVMPNTIEYMAMMSEDISRYAIFLTSKAKGRSDAQAALDAKDGTVNFNRKGKIAPVLGMLYAFANASIQGGANFINLGMKNKKKFGAVAATMMAMGFLTAELMRWIWPDDDDEEDNFDGINEFLKDNYMILPNPAWIFGKATEKYISIPLPHGFRLFHAMGVMASDMIHGHQDIAQLAGRFSNNFVNTFSPLAFDASVIGKKGELNARPFVPSWYMPVYDISSNEDFAGRRVFKEMFTHELERSTPEWQKGLRNTNKGLVEFSRALNNFAGGSDEIPANWQLDENGNWKEDNIRNFLNVNPAKLEHLLTGYTGGLGQFFNDMVKTTTSVIEVAAQQPDAEIQANDVPVLKRLYRTNYKQGAMEQYYDLKREVAGAKAMMRKLQPEDERYMMLRRNGELRTKMRLLESLEPRLEKIKDGIEKLSATEGNKDRIKELQDRREEILKSAFENLNNNTTEENEK